MSLKNQVALVTGGGRAIGRCIALRLAREGADLCIVGREETKLEETADDIRGLGARAEAIVAEVRNEDQVQAAAALARERLGSIDILVNNAGIIGPTAPVGDIRLEDWNEVLEVNLTGAFLFSKAVAPTHDPAAARQDHQYLVDCREDRLPAALSLCRIEVGSDRIDADAGWRTGAV